MLVNDGPTHGCQAPDIAGISDSAHQFVIREAWLVGLASGANLKSSVSSG